MGFQKMPKKKNKNYGTVKKPKKEEVDAVIDIMKDNVEQVINRNEKINETENLAASLEHGASMFETTSKKVEKKYYWENIKYSILTFLVVIFILYLVIG